MVLLKIYNYYLAKIKYVNSSSKITHLNYSNNSVAVVSPKAYAFYKIFLYYNV